MIRPGRVAALLFGSGLCALVYQTVWLREFRLIFGASTAATGAVLAIFMGGLGIGSALLGKRADARERPLLFYGNLEVLIALAAGISPLLLWLAAKIYFASGGSPELGIGVATILRLILATLVLGPATILMGGTLPAAARAVETDDDSGRHSVALLYGVNTLGAVAGALLSTFVMLETFGNRRTLIIAVLVNLLVAMIARSMGRHAISAPQTEEPTPQPRNLATPRLIYAASALVGFAFLLMELVWYRMLSPILGGTTYMFGLILAIALLGIGLGGAAYAGIRTKAATMGAFAITCSLEALALALPFALGDRLAILANTLRGLGVAGFDGHVAAWTLVTGIVVLPAAIIAGYQFPLLIALLGRGRENVGRQIGAAYAWNTGGSIVGSLAGGFGLLPLLSAPGTWRLVALLLVALAAAALIFTLREKQLVHAGATVAIGIVAVVCAFAMGPTAVWRHSGIGAARAPTPDTRNDLQEWINNTRRTVLWEKDGRESSISVINMNDLSFFVNGKSDGAARHDADTQIMLSLIGSILHPDPKTALIIGLGTGSTSGWVAAVPAMTRVDTVELEPVVLDVARACSAVNANAMSNPKMHITIGDAREVLLTTGKTYDLIVSEPSNPYRAGIASLFTREFYQAADRRLARGGYFLQWVQAYSMHAGTIRTMYATLTSVFPHAQTWWTSQGDMVFVASREPVVIDVAALRARINSEPYRSALHNSWRVDNVEQFLARLIANEQFARRAAKEAEDLNTDDRPVIEFGFARSIDAASTLLSQVAVEAETFRENRPLHMRGTVDWKLVDENRLQHLREATRPLNFGHLAEWALAKVESGRDNIEVELTALRTRQPIEADVILASLRARQGRHDEAVALLQRAFAGYRKSPWPLPPVMQHAITVALRVGGTSNVRARQMHDALAQPFAIFQQDNYRRYAVTELAPLFDGCGPKTLAALRAVEPHPYWTKNMLELRADCYARANLGELADRAWRDLQQFNAASPSFVVRPPGRPAARGSS